MPDAKLQVIPLGGLGEFGMNCTALRYGDDILVIDAGMMFPEDEMFGVDIVAPDFKYLLANREHVRAVVLTHGHEDHIGGLPFLLSKLPLPVYGTPFTLSLVERRLDEHEMTEEADFHEVSAGDIVEIGPFKVEFIHVTHSIPSAVALAITTPLGVIIHTGDFKVDPTPPDRIPFDLHKFAEYGKKGVLLLLSDSTNSDRPGFSESELSVIPRFEELLHRADGRVVVSCFSSSVHRVQILLNVAAEFRRKVAFLGRSVNQVLEIAHGHGLLEIPDGILLRPQDIMTTEPSRVLVVASGTQGEPMSALARVAVDSHKHLKLGGDDMVVMSARIIPGNEKGIFRMINHISRRGAKTVYGSMSPPVHVSGHGSAEELRLILNLVRPRYFVPIHGEHRQLSKHASLASHLSDSSLERTFILETGDCLEVDERGAYRAEPVPVGRICIDSGTVDEVVEELVIRDRRNLSEDGFVIPIIAIDHLSGHSDGLPEVVSRGFISGEDGASIMKEARQVVANTLSGSTAEEKGDLGVIQEKIRVDLRRFLTKKTSRRPLVLPVILEF
ncbi:MAG: ribonuclease J [Bryobacterales bacterium]|nr:ribonuclease J [Bryobacterales bacterium]